MSKSRIPEDRLNVKLLGPNKQGYRLDRFNWVIRGQWGSTHISGQADEVMKKYLLQIKDLYAQGIEPA